MEETKNKEDYNDYDNQILDVDEITGTDIKINPDYYIHKAILLAQSCLIKENIKEGYAQYRQLIEHIENLPRAANMLPQNYDEDIKTFKSTEEFKQKDDLGKSVTLADKKLGLIMGRVFSNKVTTAPLKNF